METKQAAGNKMSRVFIFWNCTELCRQMVGYDKYLGLNHIFCSVYLTISISIILRDLVSVPHEKTKANLRDLIAVTGQVIWLKFDSNYRLFSPYDIEIWWMTLKNNRAPLLCHCKLFASFRRYWSMQTGVTVRKRSIRVKIGNFFVRCYLEISRITLIRCIFYATSSFVHHFTVISEFKQYQSRNAQFGSKSPIYMSRVTFKFDEWPWKTKGHLFYAISSFVHHFVAIGQFKLELQSWTQIWVKTRDLFCPVWPWNLTDDLENNRAPFLCCFKFCASFHSDQWIQTRVTVIERPIWVKMANVLFRVTLKFDGWP